MRRILISDASWGMVMLPYSISALKFSWTAQQEFKHTPQDALQ
jgi:hypothetical protein